MGIAAAKTLPPTEANATKAKPPSVARPAAGMREPPPRRYQIVDLISHGLTDKEIAFELGLSVRTVRTHLERLYRKRRLHCRAEAVALWIHGGM